MRKHCSEVRNGHPCKNSVARWNTDICAECAPKSIPADQVDLTPLGENSIQAVRRAHKLGKKYFQMDWRIFEVMPSLCSCCPDDVTYRCIGVKDEIVEPAPGVPAFNALTPEIQAYIQAGRVAITAERRRQKAHEEAEEAALEYRKAGAAVPAEQALEAAKAYHAHVELRAHHL